MVLGKQLWCGPGCVSRACRVRSRVAAKSENIQDAAAQLPLPNRFEIGSKSKRKIRRWTFYFISGWCSALASMVASIPSSGATSLRLDAAIAALEAVILQSLAQGVAEFSA